MLPCISNSLTPILIWTSTLLLSSAAATEWSPLTLPGTDRSRVRIKAETCSRFSLEDSYSLGMTVVLSVDEELPGSCDLHKNIWMSMLNYSSTVLYWICSHDNDFQLTTHFKTLKKYSKMSGGLKVSALEDTYERRINVTLYSQCTSDFHAWLSVEHLVWTSPDSTSNQSRSGVTYTQTTPPVGLFVIAVICMSCWRRSKRRAHSNQVQQVQNQSTAGPIEMMRTERAHQPETPVQTGPDPLVDDKAFLGL